MSGLSDWFWAETVWLPPNMTWADVRPSPGSKRFTKGRFQRKRRGTFFTPLLDAVAFLVF